MKKRHLVLIISLVALFFGGRYFLFKLDWKLVSSKESPNKEYTVKHYLSRSEGGHSPYGDNYVIESWKSFPWAKNKETFFAAHCEEPSEFKWEGNGNIMIKCKITKEKIQTQAIVVHGIKVEVKTK